VDGANRRLAALLPATSGLPGSQVPALAAPNLHAGLWVKSAPEL